MNYDNENIFAKILRGELPAHAVFEDEQTLAILDVMPQADGHTLILPRSPARDFFDLDDQYCTAVLRTARKVAAAVRQAFGADGIRIMQLNGEAAGQTVFHYHLHLIPCHAETSLRSHARGMADPALLADHAEKIRAALA